MKKTKIIGTGLSGLVGSRLVELLSNKYYLIDFSLTSGVDILNQSVLKKAFQEHSDAVAVLHLAAFTDTSLAHEDRGNKKGLCYQLNVLGTKNVFDQSQKYGQHLIHFSTDFVFSGEKDGLYNEEDRPAPIDWYGQTKYEAEQLLLDSKASTTILRIAFPYRSNFIPKKDLIRKIINGLEEKSLYPMFEDQIITPTFIDDVALGVDYFLSSKKRGLFHLVGSENLSPYQLARKVAEIFIFDPSLVKKGSLRQYQKNLNKTSRFWQKNLALSNKKVKSLGIKITPLDKSLVKMKNQIKLT